MRAVVFDETCRLITDYRVPEVPAGWALIRVTQAGICGTDLELTGGYRNFSGVIGHEFVGTVAQCDDPNWAGRRVVGEINVACGQCTRCRRGLMRHCVNRKVLGIDGLAGCMADYCILPTANLHRVPETISDDRAVFTEPLSAACEILDQLSVTGSEQAVVLGDGRLGILCAWVLSTAIRDVTLVGRHRNKLKQADWNRVHTVSNAENIPREADVVVEATGSVSGLRDAVSLVRPRGTVVLKTTLAEPLKIDLAPVVVNEITILGSRCGRFSQGLRILEAYPDMPLERLITARYPLERVEAAFKRAAEPDALKVLLEMDAA